MPSATTLPSDGRIAFQPDPDLRGRQWVSNALWPSGTARKRAGAAPFRATNACHSQGTPEGFDVSINIL